MASETLATITREDVEWARQLSREKYILDTQFEINEARREGRAEGRQEVAKSLKANGVSIEIIAKATGISPEEIAIL